MYPQVTNSPIEKEHSIASSGNDKCVICLDPLSLAGRLVKVICPNGHRLHADCLRRLRKYSQECPTCRQHIFTFSSLSPLQEPLTQKAPSSPPSPINDSQLFYEDTPPPETFDDDMSFPEGLMHEQETPLTLECITGNKCEDDRSLLEGVVKLRAPALEGETPPADFIIVADVSGSMNDDNKIGQLRETLTWLTDNLNERHRMSLITFNRSPRRETPLTVMNSAGKAIQAAVIAGITAGGETDISKALTMAAAVLESRRHPNQVACVMLITDGQDTSGSLNNGGRVLVRAQEAIATIAARALLVCIGLGADHDAHLLSRLSDEARGSFQYCAGSEEIAGTV
ncbi:MAG: VWA domain-containing protein, partial [Verrucomicrobia bacterium]|nr:VWA domain-containing protein [Verrucomicrobiota bacterium]